MKQFTIRDEMTSDNKKMVDFIVNGFDRLEMQLRGSKLTDEDFNKIAKRAEKFMYECWCRSENTRSNKKEYNEALKSLRKIRDHAK